MKILSILSGICLITCSSLAHAEMHLGVDFQWRSINLRGLNANVFSKRAPGLNFHGGFSITENIKFETGFHSAKSNKGGASLKMKGIHGSILTHYIWQKDSNMRYIGGIGFAQLRHHARHPAYRLDLSRVVPRFIVGAEYNFTPSFAVRAAFVWESSKSMTKKTDMKFNNAYVLNTGIKYIF